jgi:HNH endonuclease
MSGGRGHGESCHWCGRDLLSSQSKSGVAATRDHVFPKCKGGRQTVWSCWTCNCLKGEMLPREWVEFRAANPEWWKLGPKPGKLLQRRYNRPVRVGVHFSASAEAVRALARQIIAEW